MTEPAPLPLERIGEVEELVVQVHDWTRLADERFEQQRNRLDFLTQGMLDVRAELVRISRVVDELLARQV